MYRYAELYDPTEGTLLHSFEHPKAVWSTRLSADGQLLAVAGRNLLILILSVQALIYFISSVDIF